MKIKYIAIFLVLLCCFMGATSAAEDISTDVVSDSIGSVDDLLKLNIPNTHDCINPYNNLDYNTTIESARYDCDIDHNLGGTGVNISYRFVTAPLKLTDETT